jgi:signal transduction histidine kinase
MAQGPFHGKSEMAQRMRALDWSRTTLGPVDQWPEPLRTSVSTCLDCAFPIVLWWGRDLAILYNDEYIPMLGPAKHPAALGELGSKVWAEIWDVVGPMLSHVMVTAEPTRSRDLLLHIDRGYPEEAYFSFSYSPIHGEDGHVAGIFCPVIETTGKVIGERRLRSLRDLAARCKGADCEDEAYAAAAAILGDNPQDVPFALLYRMDDAQATAERVAAIGIDPGHDAAPDLVVLGGEGDSWLMHSVAVSGRTALVTDLTARFADLPTGAWKVAPNSALVLPVSLPGQERPRAVLIAAVSPMRALDLDYRTFFELVATQIASGLADAQALEAERRRSESLAEIDRAKTAFFSNVSHEFRTPLTLILGPLEDALRQANTLPADTAAALEIAHRNSLRMLKLVNTLLDFSRIEAGRIEASFEPVDLSLLTIEIASVFRSAIEKAGLRFVVDCAPLSEPVYVDRDMWEKVVLNLISNAFKFTFDGEIRVSLRWRGDGAELRVSDSGAGIPAAALPMMFQRFHRVKQVRARTHEGTGIGLALVRELVLLHGGDVAVHSREGEGATFTVTVPAGTAHLPSDRVGHGHQHSATAIGAQPYVEEALRWLPAAAQAPVDANETALPAATNPAPAGPRPRVLVADDNADMRDYVTRILGEQCEVEAVSDGLAALERLRAHPPDLVLSDVMMPGLDGFGLVAAVREQPETRGIPIILLSARAGEEARIEGLGAGADRYLAKPFSARELLAHVTSLIELARLRREADARKDEFLALLAHELRNPLAPIRTGLELIRLSGDAPDAVRRVRTMIERQLAVMVRLIDDLLDVSRITSGKIVLQRRPTPVAELIQSAIEAQRAAIDQSHLELITTLPARSYVVDVDPVRFVQVLSNVLHNACKFTPAHGRIRLLVEVDPVSSGHRQRHVAVSVIDNGIGMTEPLLSRVFELFTQGAPPADHPQGGLGIGLALAKRLVEMHGGSITAQSAGPGRGSTFVVRMPLSVVSAHEEMPTPQPSRRVRSRALIIDDNRDAAMTTAMFVEELGGTAFTAYDGPAGLRAIESFRPDIVFMDIGMPGLDGYEVCRRIRQMPSQRHVVIVAVTGWGQTQDKNRAFDVGFDAHLTKPVDPDTLAQLLAGAAV